MVSSEARDNLEEVTQQLSDRVASTVESAPTRIIAKITAGCLYVAASCSILAANKLTMRLWPYPFALLLFQTVFSVLAILILEKAQGRTIRISLAMAKGWIPVAVAFCSGIATSMLALKVTTIPTLVAMKACGPFVAAVAESALWGRVTRHSTKLTLACVVLGACVYSSNGLVINFLGFVLCTAHVLCSTASVMIVKYLDSNGTIDYSTGEKAFYNNSLSLPLLLFAGCFQVEFRSAWGDLFSLDHSALVVVLFAGLAGLMISLVGFFSQRQFSSGAYLTLLNMAKIPTVIVSWLVFHDVLQGINVIGLVISFTGGLLYAIDTTEELRNCVASYVGTVAPVPKEAPLSSQEEEDGDELQEIDEEAALVERSAD